MAHTNTRDYQTWKRRLLGSKLEQRRNNDRGFQRLGGEPSQHAGQSADLTPDQLKDIGHAEAPLPTFNVKAGLITNLMSMR